jgi:MFS family permease
VTRVSTFAALRHYNFRIFFFGLVVSLVGVWMQRVAQAWLVLDLTGSAFYVGLVDALGSLPVLLLSLYAGALADRFSKHRMVIATQSAAMVVAFAFAVFVYTGRDTIGVIIVLATLMGVATAFDIPARQSFFVEIVGKEDLASAIALNSSAFSATRLIGPAIAGLAIAAVGVGACFLANGISYLAVLGALLAMRLSPVRRSDSPPQSAWRNIRTGLGYVLAERSIRTLLVNIAVMSIFGLPIITLLPVFTRDVMGQGAREYGWMMSAVGGGALIGALVVATFAARMPKGLVLGWAATVFGALVIGIGLVHSLGVALVLLTLLGAAMITMTALTNTLLQTLAHDELRGRVVSAYTFAYVGMMPFGSLLAGTVADLLGVPVALLIGGSISLVASAILLLRSPSMRQA